MAINHTTRDFYADAILDLLCYAPQSEIRTEPGRLLIFLASEIKGEQVRVGDIEYHATSQAVLMLEEMELVKVDRLYHHSHARANMLVSIRIFDR